MSIDLDVVVGAAGEGERLVLPFGEVLVRLSGADTEGALSVVEMRLAPRTVGAALHVHHDHQEYFEVREGELTVDLAAGSRTVGPDGIVSVPRGHAHGFRNGTDRWTTFVGLFTPAGYEDYFREVARLAATGAAVTPDVLAGLRAGYGTEAV
ncbi:cupin domain-containing protein [Aquipuribacter hungaricus]|uniref:Cupin domain-containing protein n=1 Tax=Aquipuribacter hungaricus TaxID=545624 RepID=A0ABV7WB89_9MICO